MDALTELVEETQLPEEELASILRQGALLRLPYLESRFQSARAEYERFERKYNTTLKQLRQEGLANDAGYELHEDFIEWEYWSDEMGRLQQTIAQIQHIVTATSSRPT
jgi:hypothetical protein